MKDALIITALGLGTVMAVLWLIMMMIAIMGAIIGKTKSGAKNNANAAAVKNEPNYDTKDEIAAIIAAVVSMYLEQQAAPLSSSYLLKTPIRPPEPAAWIMTAPIPRTSVIG